MLCVLSWLVFVSYNKVVQNMRFQMFIITRFLKELSVLADTVLGDMLFKLFKKKKKHTD